MIVFCELQMQGEKHVLVNSGLMRVLQLAYKKEKMVAVADKVHYQILLQRLQNLDEPEPFEIFDFEPKEDLKKNTLNKATRQIKLAYRVFRHAKKTPGSVIVFSSAFPFVAPVLNYFSKIFKQKIIICQHGDIGVLLLKKDLITTKVFRVAVKYFLKHRDTRYNTSLFYGKTIKDNLFRLYPEFPSSNIITIDLPHGFTGDPVIKELKPPIIIAAIGTAIIAKNSHLLFKLAEMAKISVEQQKVKFTQIGSMTADIAAYANNYVEADPKENFLTSEIFKLKLTQANYFIYFFEKGGYYDLCPSGTFFDALIYAKPIIALRNDFFQYYFNKLGNIGYLCDSLDEMNAVITEIADGKKNGEYELQIQNIINSRTLLSIENIAADFYKQQSVL